jgi:hypothetical protein
MNAMISLFIDNELSLEEKSLFIEKLRDDTPFYLESLQMLQQEMLIRSDVVDRAPQADIRLLNTWILTIKNLLRPSRIIPAAATAIACAILFLTILPSNDTKPNLNRFVIYRPDVSHVEIVGSFTGWKRAPLRKISTSGYWEGMFELSEGEHRYTYILEGDKHYTDPTVLTVEKDDFGGTNSIIRVKAKA